MQFNYRPEPNWPPLAWLVQSPLGSDICHVYHGQDVETRPQWFCEAVWPGEFGQGAFDETDLIAGSGARLRADCIRFVSAGNTIDRLLWLKTEHALWVSNSLACLAGISGAEFDPAYAHYYEDFTSAVKGVRAYKRTLATSLGEVGIQLYGHLDWDGTTVLPGLKPAQPRDFSSFSRYEYFLQSNLERLAKNIADEERRRKFSLLATLSAGYDSAACAALAKPVGCAQALCIDRDRDGLLEGGDAVGRALGLDVTLIDRMAWRDLDQPELLFLAAGGEAEMIALAALQRTLAGRVLLTGYHGDQVWGKDSTPQTDEIVRGGGGHSGLSLSEFRLWAGFIHCPITFWGVRQIADICRISNSPQMQPWDVSGDYSRPIPRRILETAGVDRHLFGNAKHASAVGLTECLSEGGLIDYQAWLKAHRPAWLKRGKIPPMLSGKYEWLPRRAANTLNDALLKLPLLWRLAADNDIEKPSRLRRFVFPWAVEQVARRYRAALSGELV